MKDLQTNHEQTIDQLLEKLDQNKALRFRESLAAIEKIKDADQKEKLLSLTLVSLQREITNQNCMNEALQSAEQLGNNYQKMFLNLKGIKEGLDRLQKKLH